jgi:UDP-N-acetylmuramate: L-alanyl-gamma-D-glutamyl-meso-diaminopimelate ligase
MNVHFISIGGSAMHNLALALKEKNYQISGSDDEIVEPSKSRLAKAGLLPVEMGWFPEKIHADLDAVIIGMHARADNPELLKAKELGLPIYSYPEYLYEQSKNKIRLVVGGSHGKTSITAMILHVLQHANMNIDYMVGAQLTGFTTMVKLSEQAKVMVLEGDEYLSSPIDRRPKFHLYKGNIAILSGIAWDHINVFPTFENYLEQFSIFIDTLEPNATLIYCKNDEELKNLVEAHPRKDLTKIAYTSHQHIQKEGVTYLKVHNVEIPLLIFGEHNMQNLQAAYEACKSLGLADEKFYEAIQSFKGAANSPSKLKATIQAVKQQFGEQELVACMELHTFSSLNKEFLQEYKNSMSQADVAIVYYNPHTIEHKRLENISPEEVKQAFDRDDILIFNESAALKTYLESRNWKETNLLLMSSGNYDGIDVDSFAKELLHKH